MASAASGLRAASRASLIRLRVSCRFTALKSTVFTPILLRYFNLKGKLHGHAATQRKTTNTYTTKQLGGAQIPSTSGLAGVEQVLNIGNQFVRRNVRYCRADNNQVKRAVIQQSQCPTAGARHRDLVSAQVQVERNFLQRVSIHNQDVSARSWRLKILFDHNTAIGVPSFRMLPLPLKYSKRKRSH